ncbi:uncharacterized protein GBIM_02572 [Gryllus bimaculatus]|nr:uncharacterized protein GBIM_02572 [Gryllus bimaculatus]
MCDSEYLTILDDITLFCPGFVPEATSDIHCILDQLLKSLVGDESSAPKKLNLIYFLELKSNTLCEEIGDVELVLATLKNVCNSSSGNQVLLGQCLISSTTILLESSEKFLGAEFDRLFSQHVNLLLDYVNQSNCSENVYVRSVSADSLIEVELCYPLVLKPCLENIYALTVKELSAAHQQYTSLLSLMMKHSSASSQFGSPLWNTYPQLVFKSKFLGENNSAVVSSVYSNTQLLSDYLGRMCHQLKSIEDIRMVLTNNFDGPDIQLKKFILFSHILKHKNGSSKFLLQITNNMRREIKHNKGFKCKSVFIKALYKLLSDYEDVSHEEVSRLVVLASTEDISTTPFIVHFVRQVQTSFPASPLPVLILTSLVNTYTQPNEHLSLEALSFVIDIFQEAVSNRCSIEELSNVLQGFISKCENDDVQDRAQLYFCLLQSLSDKKLKAVLQGPRQTLPLTDDSTFHSQFYFQKLDKPILYLCKENQSTSSDETFKYIVESEEALAIFMESSENWGKVEPVLVGHYKEDNLSVHQSDGVKMEIFFEDLWKTFEDEFQSVVLLGCSEVQARAFVKQKFNTFIVGEDDKGYHVGIYLPPGNHLLMRYYIQSSKTIVKFVTDYIYNMSNSIRRRPGHSRRCERFPTENDPESSDSESNESPEVPNDQNVNDDYYEISKWESEEVAAGQAEASVSDHPPIRKIFVGNLNERTNQHDLRNLFRRFGEIMECHRSRDKLTGIRRNYGFVTFKNPEDAAKVLCAPQDELFLHWRELRVAAADAWHQPQELPDGRILWQKKNAKSLRRTSKDGEKLIISPELMEARARSSREVDESQCRINILNDDCLMHIFSFLPKMDLVKIERVCKRWQAVSRSMWLYLQHLDFNFMFYNPRAFPTANILRGLLVRCGPNLASLDLSFRPNEFNNRIFSIVAKLTPNLRSLNASGLPLASHSMRRLSEVAHQLQRVNFDGCSGLLDRDLRSLFQKCPNLESVVLSHNNQLTGKCLAGFRSEKLCELVLDHCNNLRSRFLADGLRRMKKLTHLSVNSCINLTSSDIVEILESLPQLQYLSIGKYFPLLNSTALRSLQHLKDLVSLNLQHNPAVTDSVVEVISLNCLKLEKLNITGCSVIQSSSPAEHASLTNAGFRWLARLPQLVDLNMSYLAVVTDEALDAVADRGKLKRLECRGCPTFTDAGCMRVVALCGDLERFDFSGCDHVTNLTIETALEAVKERTNNVKLTIIAGGTKVENVESEHPLLQVDLVDLCLAHMRPDFVDDIYFQSSDNDDDDDDDDNEEFFNGNLEEYFLAFDDSRSTFSDDIEWDRYSYYSYDGYDYYEEY